MSKKLRLVELEVEDDAIMDEGGVIQEDVSTKKIQANSKKKKKKDPPLPEPCSPAEVLYREIRKLVGEDVVDDVTKSGRAFSAPYQHGERVVVKIEMLGSGGELISHTKFQTLTF